MVATKTPAQAPSVASTKTASRRASISPSTAASCASDNARAGLTITKSGDGNPNPIQHGKMGQAERAFSAASTFLSGIMAISASQFIGAPLKLVDHKFYNAYMAWTKESFAVLVTTITQWWSPTIVRVSGDESMKDQLFQMDDGSLKCNFPHRLILMANHQLYTDWLYLWWIAYTNKMHGHIYIILKEALKQLPIFGWGAQFYNFIFLSRKWETDRHRFKHALSHLKDARKSMWLLIFPEGTNLSEVTREKSAAWAKKSGVPDMKHQLLPRSTGLQFCLKELRQTTNWLYDCTVAYEGIPEGLYGQDIFTLRSSFLEGRPPKSVNMFWRRFRISNIPLDNEEAFRRWLNNRWREKDYILEYFYKYNHFPEEDAMQALAAVSGKRKPKHVKMIITEVRAGGWDEFLSIFGPLTSAAGALSSFDMTEPINLDALLGQIATQQHSNLVKLKDGPIAAASQQAVSNALRAAQQSKAIPWPVLNYLLKEPRKTQEQMQQAIVQSAKKSGNIQIAKRTKSAPAAKRAIPGDAEENVAKAFETMKAADSEKPKKNNDTGPTSALSAKTRSAMPLANMESMVTRPLTTAIVHTAAASIQSASTQRATQKGAVRSKSNQRKVNSAVASKAPNTASAKTQTSGINMPRGVMKQPPATAKKPAIPRPS